MSVLSINYSVIICSYNKLEYLKKVATKIRSLRPNVEIILSDDFSTDGTIDWSIKSGIFSKIHVEKEIGNYRLNTLRNKGTDLSSNEFVVILDADCLPESSFFSGHDIVFHENPNAISIGITRRYDSEGINLKLDDFRIKYCKNNSPTQCGWEVCYGGNVAFKKSVWLEIGKFSEEYNGCWGFEDLDFSYRLHLKSYCFYLNPIACVRHLEHPIHKSATEASQGKCRNADLFYKRTGIKMM